ncbi:hypothetical protein [Mycetocola spongiae]|uniref:hypothetical protein n=1 Tax=Mycetocola spongiae TaxID=2859226 RepID=UPI001CF4CFD9|nr:hypothetical protein [Mycetocola spongiae]UCR88291.1 hypothetical protein KXZ72_09910 [Mycetocola spongiae]
MKDSAENGLPEGTRKPTRREILRPAELLVMALIFAVFAGLIALMSSRDPMLSAILAGIAFIVGVIGLAMFSLAVKPDDLEVTDIREQDQKPKR